MTAQNRMDAAYGRRGGRIVPGKRGTPQDARVCTRCGGTILTSGSNGMHFVCDPSTDIGKTS
jgi:RNA polymerase subunit RPABC4/transcription elongation factor Spt4